MTTDRTLDATGAERELLPSERDMAHQAGLKAFNASIGYYWEKVAAAIDSAIDVALHARDTRAAAPPSPPVVTEEMVDAAVRAYYHARTPDDGDPFRDGMRAAIEATLSNRRAGGEG
jgi:hypothetical protein